MKSLAGGWMSAGGRMGMTWNGLPLPRRLACAALALCLVSGCVSAARRTRPAEASPDCEFIVRNLTHAAIEVRVQRGTATSVPVGALGPGEALTSAAPCAMGAVAITGIEIPFQVGARLRFGAVYGVAQLAAGTRPQVAFYWP